MNRRDSLKVLTLSSLSAGILLEACQQPQEKAATGSTTPTATTPGPAGVLVNGREVAELDHNKKLESEKFFTDHEFKTITVLSDLILPKDNHSGSASDAGVPAFIEFIVKDMPAHQVPMRGGLRWLDLQCMNQYGPSFLECTSAQQTDMLDKIAYPQKSTPEMAQGVAFFSLIRNLTATGFFSSEMGIHDIGYMGNTPNQWNGVPQDVLNQYGLKYDAKTLAESAHYST
ncbi:MAG: gluconate 2-dehydrogenase subunit 3 family protein [Chitinophagaceae bacterium]